MCFCLLNYDLVIKKKLKLLVSVSSDFEADVNTFLVCVCIGAGYLKSDVASYNRGKYLTDRPTTTDSKTYLITVTTSHNSHWSCGRLIYSQ